MEQNNWQSDRFGGGKSEPKLCSICGRPYGMEREGYGNNASPVNEGRCCDRCNSTVVVPARMRRVAKG